MKALEIWGGLECTINRVNDNYFDQCDRTGHWQRANDLERISSLGVKKLRYPVLWEKVCAGGEQLYDWSHLGERLETIRGLGMDPIAGLLHHGSGPKFTSLLDPKFPEKISLYA